MSGEARPSYLWANQQVKYIDEMKLALGLACWISANCFACPSMQSELFLEREAFQTAFNKSDVNGLGSLMLPDTLLLSFSGQQIKGGEKIAAGMAAISKSVTLSLKAVQSRKSGDMAYEAGTWEHVNRSSSDSVDKGTYVWIWRRTGSGWQLETFTVTAAPRPKS